MTNTIARRDERAVEVILREAAMRFQVLVRDPLAEAIRDVVVAAGVDAARRSTRTGTFRSAAASIKLSFDKTNPLALRWAAERSGTLIRGITDETLAAVRAVIARAFAEGIPPMRAANLLASIVGLTARQADAVLNLGEALLDNPGGKVWAGNTAIRVPDEGIDDDLLATRTSQYADRLLLQRAEAIARTETIAASNEGQRELWLQAVDEGFLTGNEQRVWIASLDERVCPICEELNGETTGLEEPFSTGDLGPPAHPLCRCATGLAPS